MDRDEEMPGAWPGEAYPAHGALTLKSASRRRGPSLRRAGRGQAGRPREQGRPERQRRQRSGQGQGEPQGQRASPGTRTAVCYNLGVDTRLTRVAQHRHRSSSRSRTRSPGGHRSSRHRSSKEDRRSRSRSREHRRRDDSRERYRRDDSRDRYRRRHSRDRSRSRDRRPYYRDRSPPPRSVGGPMNASVEEAEAHAKVSVRENRVYVGNLAYPTTYKDLEKFCSKGGWTVAPGVEGGRGRTAVGTRGRRSCRIKRNRGHKGEHRVLGSTTENLGRLPWGACGRRVREGVSWARQSGDGSATESSGAGGRKTGLPCRRAIWKACSDVPSIRWPVSVLQRLSKLMDMPDRAPPLGHPLAGPW